MLNVAVGLFFLVERKQEIEERKGGGGGEGGGGGGGEEGKRRVGEKDRKRKKVFGIVGGLVELFVYVCG